MESLKRNKDLKFPFNKIDLRKELNLMEKDYSTIKTNISTFEKDYEITIHNFSEQEKEDEEFNKLNNNKFICEL